MLDHIAKPYIKDGKIDEWRKEIQTLGGFENLYCKVSGMVTEAKWNAWRKEDFKPYLDTVVESFGTDRLMFGSDWPVCLVAASSYAEVLDLVTDYFQNFSHDEKKKIFGGNAIRFYNLD